jgi:hypothetical protein
MSDSPAKYLILFVVVIGIFVLLWLYRKKESTNSDKPGYYALEVHPSETETKSQHTFSELSGTDQIQLETQRQIVLGALKEKYGISELRKDKSDLAFLQRLVEDKVFSDSQTIELQSIGIVFGDVLSSELGLRWVMITDEYGKDPTLLIPETQVNFNALTMVSKRVERGDAVDMNRLYQIVESESKRFRKEFEIEDR